VHSTDRTSRPPCGAAEAPSGFHEVATVDEAVAMSFTLPNRAQSQQIRNTRELAGMELPDHSPWL